MVVKAVAIGTPFSVQEGVQTGRTHFAMSQHTHVLTRPTPTHPLTNKTTTTAAQYNSRGMLYGVAFILWQCLHALATG